MTLSICAALISPRAEIGMYDDWSYIRTAQVFAETGHIAYNGWATAMLGAQLLPAALFIKLFGFSFWIVRLTTLLLAMATAFLFQRCLVRSGINEWNAMIGSLTLILTPLFLPLSVSFMSDIAGLFSILLCFYSCLRALRADSENAMAGWVCFAALSNVVGGTARQISWLGVIVMVPCTIWLLRTSRRVILSGVLSLGVSGVLIRSSLDWFHRQPYTQPEPIFRGHIGRSVLEQLPFTILRPGLDVVLLMLPILLMFLPLFGRLKSRARITTALCCVALIFALHRAHALRAWLPPYLIAPGNYLSVEGLYSFWPMRGERPVLLHDGARLFLFVATLAALLTLFGAFSLRLRRINVNSASSKQLPWKDLLLLTVPFTLSYVALLAPRALFVQTLDRYLLPVLVVSILLAVRYYQERIKTRLPAASLVLVAFVGAYSIAVTHDVFSMYRGILTAIDEVRSAGVPATAIDGGLEFNGWTQITQTGYVQIDGMRMPDGVPVPKPSGSLKRTCPIFIPSAFPNVFARYSLSFDRNACEGDAGFAPATYRTWLPPAAVNIYVVKNADDR